MALIASVGAQCASAQPHIQAADTALARLLATATLEAATPPRAHLTPTSAPFPWRIIVPNSPTGRLLGRTLGRDLRARPLGPGDTLHAVLTLADLCASNRLLTVPLAVGLAWRCPGGQSVRSVAGYQVEVRRVRAGWHNPRIRDELIADPVPCAAVAEPG